MQTGLLSSLLSNIQSMLSESEPSLLERQERTAALTREVMPASLPSGPGAAMLPDLHEPLELVTNAVKSPLPWNTVYVADDELCNNVLDAKIVKENQVLVVRRGGCSFSEKLRNIPSFAPSARALQLVIIVSYPEHDSVDADLRRQHAAEHGEVYHEHGTELIQPLLDKQQTTPGGMRRPHPIPLVMVAGGDYTMDSFRRAAGVGFRRRWWFESQGTRIGNLFVV
jgi:hypothetical protein